MAVTFKMDSLSRKLSQLNNPEMDQCVAGVYIGCNETETETVKATLENCGRLRDPCHVGFSGWHNFDIMVQRKSTRGVLCDFNPRTGKFLEFSLISTTLTQNRQQYAQVITRYVEQRITQFSPNVKGENTCIPADEEIVIELTRQGSWLSTDEGYAHIQKLAREGKISLITEDIRNVTVFQKVANILIDNAIAIDTLYVSNISHYMFSNEDKMKYKATVENLFTYETKLIHCVGGLQQTVLNGAVRAQRPLELSDLFVMKVATSPAIVELPDEDAQQNALVVRNSNSSSSNSSQPPQITPEQLQRLLRLMGAFNS